ncbi:hypothetical protein BGZ52_002654 [Haplosporangium bisporale]|nr:hypothetical protein BGZ52_002654 [Haplosporangium bisporale]
MLASGARFVLLSSSAPQNIAAKKAIASNDTDKSKVLFRLKEFYLFYGQFDHEIGATFPFLRRCRALERLRLPRVYSRRAMAEFAEQIPDNWANLEHLNMGTLDPGRQAGDEFEARILARCATAKSRDDPTLAARDVEYSSSWVCLGLGSLRLKLRSGDMSTGEDRSNRASLPRMTMWQIQHLTKLQDLRLYLEDHSWKDSGFREYEESRIEHSESVIGTWGTLNLSDAPQAFQNLAELETMELRSMKEFINPAAPKSSRKHWKKLKWVHYN